MKRSLFKFSEFQAEFPLSKELPYWDFIEASEAQDACVVLADGSLVQGLRLTGVALETMDSDQINSFVTQLRSILNSVADGIELQFVLDMDSNYDTLIAKHEGQGAKANANSVISAVSETRVQALRREGKVQNLRNPHLYLFVFLRVHTVQGGIGSFFVNPKSFSKVRREEHEKRLKELQQSTYSIGSNLSSLGVRAATLALSEIEGLVYRVLNPSRQGHLGVPQLSLAHREQEFSVEELRAVPELAEPSPREQLAFSDVIQGVDSFFLDGFFHRVVTLKTLPEFTHAALVSRLTTLPFQFLLSVQVRVPEQSRELSSLQTKRRMAHSMSASRDGRVTDLESEAKLQSTEELLRELINTGQKIFYFQVAVLLRASTSDELDQHTKVVLSRFREMNGGEGLAETVAGFKVFKTLLPAGNTVSVRPKRVKTDNLGSVK